jgi:hypothetical protein
LRPAYARAAAKTNKTVLLSANATKDVAILRQRQKTHNLPATPEEQD